MLRLRGKRSNYIGTDPIPSGAFPESTSPLYACLRLTYLTLLRQFEIALIPRERGLVVVIVNVHLRPPVPRMLQSLNVECHICSSHCVLALVTGIIAPASLSSIVISHYFILLDRVMVQRAGQLGS